MKRVWLLILLVFSVLLSGCVAPKTSSKISNPPEGSYGTLAVTVERPTASVSAPFLERLFFPKAYAVESGQRMVRIAVTDLLGSVSVTRDVLAVGRTVSTTMRVPARPAYKVIAVEYYVEDIGDIWTTRITNVGTTYPVTVGPDQTVMAQVTLSSSGESLKPVLTVDSYTAVAGEEVIAGTVTIRSDLKLADLYLITLTRDSPYCVRMQDAFGFLEDESSPYFRAMWTIRPIVFDHTDKITCQFIFATEIIEARPSGFGREEDPFLYLTYPEEPPYLEVTFFPPSVEIGL